MSGPIRHELNLPFDGVDNRNLLMFVAIHKVSNIEKYNQHTEMLAKIT